MRVLAISLALFGLTVSCGSKESISLGASIANPQVAVTEQTLGLDLTGSFDLSLEVGPEADGSATVTLDKFSLVRAADQSALVDTLDVTSQGETFPLVVGKGEKKSVPFVISSPKLLESTAKANLCSGEVQIVGSVKHTLNGGETKPVQSLPISISGC
jgi:hypothetical protein